MATYTPYGGTAFDCYAVLDRNALQVPGGYDSQVSDMHSAITLLAEEMADRHPHGEPRRGDTIHVGGQDWTVEAITADDGYTVTVVVK